MKKHIPLIFLFFSFNISAQTETSPSTRFIANLARYRNELIAGNFDNYKTLIHLDTLWKQPEAMKEEAEDLLFNVIYGSEMYLLKPKKIVKRVNKKLPDYPLLYLLTEDNINIILKNKHLIDLLTNGILKPDPPFQIDPETYIFEELDFYGIKDGMTIGEIGAGNGVFSLMLGLAYDSLTIYVNDLDFFSVRYAKEKITGCGSKNSGNEYFFVEGKKKSTQLENIKLDKIIIRNAFHHFSRRPEMLASIKQSLKPGGDLYIADPYLCTGHDFDCDEIMAAEDIKKAILDNGFEIIDEKYKDEWSWLYLHCQTKN
ncbi:MAG TPA: methyltransferase domain-containing protein [Bacteroidetes bacterium]|nr:methyltransferase domain-containing protein [Bacteroidota bacterium]